MNFDEYLLKDEKVLWKGQPETSVIFTRADIFLVPFSLMWGGFAIFWELGVLGISFMASNSSSNNNPPIFFALFGIPFVIIGLYFIFGRFIYKRKQKEKTWYLVTNKRVIVINNFWGTKVDSANIDSIPSYNKSTRSDGIGSITFGNSSFLGGMYANVGMDFFGSFYGPIPPTFFDIKDAESVFKKVQELRNQS